MTSLRYYGTWMLRFFHLPVLKPNYSKLSEEQHLLTDSYSLLGLSCWREVEHISGLKKTYWEVQASFEEEKEWHEKKGLYLASQVEVVNDEESNRARQELWMEQMEERLKLLAEISEIEKEEKAILEELEILELKRKVKKMEYSQEEAALLERQQEKKKQKKILTQKQATVDKNINCFKSKRGSRELVFETEQSQKDKAERGRKAEYMADFRRIEQARFKVLTKVGSYVFQNSIVDARCSELLSQYPDLKWILEKLSQSVNRRLKLLNTMNRV